MSPVLQITNILWVISLLLVTCLVVRMAREGLYRIYKGFFVYLCASVLQTLLMLPFGAETKTYAWLYLVTQPLIWVLFILSVVELFSLVLRRYRGIASLGRWVMMGAVAMAVLTSILTLAPDLQHVSGKHQILMYYTVIERGISSSLVAFLLIMSAFLVWCPIRLSRNVILHTVVFSGYFLSSTVALFVRNVEGLGITALISAVLIGITNVCLMIWILFFARKGEEVEATVRHSWSPEDGEKLVRQLDAINAALLRSSTK